MLAKVLYRDAFNPTLYSSPPLNVSAEQLSYIQRVIEISSSDSKFAEKAFRSILRILTGGNTPLPEVTSLSPNSATIGDASFTISVMGKGFDANTKIVFAGQEEPTTLVSPTEVTTGVNMDVWVGPDTVQVGVMNGDGVPSNTMPFEFKAVTVQTARKEVIHAAEKAKK